VAEKEDEQAQVQKTQEEDEIPEKKQIDEETSMA
jgi:hypothetical protein